MALNYSFTGEWNAATKIIVGNWVKQKLTVVQDGEAPEDLFLEYIIVMIGNGKRMQELSHELQDFIGEEKANNFANDLGFFLQSLPNPESVPPLAVAEVVLTTTPAVTLIAAKKDILDGGLQSSRSIGPTTQKPMRLLENAIRSTTSNSVKRKVVGDRVVAGNAGLVTQSAQLSSTGSASSGGLFTKRGSAKLNDAGITSASEEDEAFKKRRVIFDGNSEIQAFRTQPQFRGNEVPRNSHFVGMGNAEGSVMNLGQHPSPGIMGHSTHGSFNFPTMDPAFMYIEQMNMMAHRSGFASVEEMMFFQQNMMASMMGGGMPMPMHGGPAMSMHPGGPHMLGPPFEPYAKHEARILQQRGRGGGRTGTGGRGVPGRGRGRSTERSTTPSLNAALSAPPAGRAPVPLGLPPVPPAAVPTAVLPPAVTAAVPAAIISLASEIESTPDSSFGYSGRGFADRGRGRGSRGRYQGGEGRGLFGAEGVPFEGGGGRFAYAAARGRSAYRGRGRGAADSSVAPFAPPAAGPVSFNKVWVRQADIESPLVAGR